MSWSNSFAKVISLRVHIMLSSLSSLDNSSLYKPTLPVTKGDECVILCGQSVCFKFSDYKGPVLIQISADDSVLKTSLFIISTS